MPRDTDRFVNDQAQRNIRRYAKGAKEHAQRIIDKLQMEIHKIEEGRLSSIEKIYGQTDAYNEFVGKLQGALEMKELLDILREED